MMRSITLTRYINGFVPVNAVISTEAVSSPMPRTVRPAMPPERLIIAEIAM